MARQKGSKNKPKIKEEVRPVDRSDVETVTEPNQVQEKDTTSIDYQWSQKWH